MSSTENSGYGVDVIISEPRRVGAVSTVKAKLQGYIAAVDVGLSPKEQHVSFNWKNPVINDEVCPFITMRLGTAQYTDVVYGRKIGNNQNGQFIVVPFSLHVWNEKLNYEMQDGVDESKPTTDLAEKVVTALLRFKNDSHVSGICYFYNITSRESEPERGPQNLNRVIIEGFMTVKRPLDETAVDYDVETAYHYIVGATGPAGPQGEEGLIGPQGPRGITGEKGDTGVIGFTGPEGEQGLRGIQGLKGEDGENGINADPSIHTTEIIQRVVGDELNYNYWVVQWAIPAVTSSSKIMVSEHEDRIVLYFAGRSVFAILRLADGAVVLPETEILGTAAEYDTPYSKEKYFSVLLSDDNTSLVIYKNGVEKQRFDLSDIVNYGDFNNDYPAWVEMSFTNDGKYLCVTTMEDNGSPVHNILFRGVT